MAYIHNLKQINDAAVLMAMPKWYKSTLRYSGGRATILTENSTILLLYKEGNCACDSELLYTSAKKAHKPVSFLYLFVSFC